jgi:hypothetical protein
MNVQTNGQYYATFTEFEATQTAPLGSVLLTWTAPGDDLTLPGVGSVVSYDIRYDTGSFSFGSATPTTTVPLPLPAGSQQTFLVTGLPPEVVHLFGLTATDDAGNVSAVSNVASAASKGFPPNAVSDLSAHTPGLMTIDLQWTAPSDPPSNGAVDVYEIRQSTSLITEANFDAAQAVLGTIPGPATPGTLQNMTVTGLTPNTLYYFALKSLDGGTHRSDISNVISFSTLDNVEPDPVSNLTLQYFDDDTSDFLWTATGDDGNVGSATSFDLRYRTEPLTDANFGGAATVLGEPTPGPPGTVHRLVVDGLAPGTVYYFGVRVIDEQGNDSPVSNVVSFSTLSDLAEPLMTNPPPGSTLPGSTQMFQWAQNGLGATQWWLYLGSTRGAKNLHDSGNLGPALSRTVTGLPRDGSTLWARLWYFAAGVWGYEDFQFTAFTPPPPPPPPIITSPAPSSTLPGASALFNWTSNGNPVTEWWLYAGSTIGGNNFYNSGSLGTATSTTVNGLPTNGSTVHVRLFFRVAGLWASRDFQYTAATGPGPGNPAITSPAPGATFTSGSVTFQWTANGAAVTEWWLYVGTSSGDSDLHNSMSLPPGTTQRTVTGLPTDGSQIFVRHYYRIGGLWQFTDYQYTASIGGGGGTPTISTPAPGSTLTAASQLFQWTANGSPVTEWWLYVGSTQGAKNYFDSGSLGAATTQVLAAGLPTNGSTIHVRLYYRIGGLWSTRDFQYTAANIRPDITSPLPGSTLGGASQLFQWTSNGVPVTEWWLYAGSTAGGNQYFNSGSIPQATTQVNVNGLPTDGSTVHVTLFFRVSGLWQSRAFTYTAAP